MNSMATMDASNQARKKSNKLGKRVDPAANAPIFLRVSFIFEMDALSSCAGVYKHFVVRCYRYSRVKELLSFLSTAGYNNSLS
jgi:hypothetical protein